MVVNQKVVSAGQRKSEISRWYRGAARANRTPQGGVRKRLKRRPEGRLEGGEGVSQMPGAEQPRPGRAVPSGRTRQCAPGGKGRRRSQSLVDLVRTRWHGVREHCRAWGLLNSFTEHTSHHLNKIYNSVAFKVFAAMCNHHHSQF